MSFRTKNSLKRLGAIWGVLVFALVFFLNVKFTFTEENSNNNFSISNIEVSLLRETKAAEEPPVGEPCTYIFDPIMSWCMYQGGNCCGPFH
jgi:hypothetical protein